MCPSLRYSAARRGTCVLVGVVNSTTSQTPVCRSLGRLLLTWAFSLGWSVAPCAAAPVAPPATGYGATGSFDVETEQFASPLFLGRQVTVYLPVGATEPVPTVFFAHGFGGDNPAVYDSLMRHIASRGYAAVFSPYSPLGSDQIFRYAQMFAGYKKAIEELPSRLDPSRVGYLGHSLGGGAVPTLARQGFEVEGWGAAGAFLFPLAPWYSYGISPTELASFPSHTKMLVQIYDDDVINDHRMAIDLFNNINIDPAEKDFLTVHSDSRPQETLTADHDTPIDLPVNALDFYGVYKSLDALADYAFTGSLLAKSVALGGGTPEQAFMGQWGDGAAVRPMSVSDTPLPQYPQEKYAFGFSSIFNPRRDFLPVPEPSSLALAGTAAILLLTMARRPRCREPQSSTN